VIRSTVGQLPNREISVGAHSIVVLAEPAEDPFDRLHGRCADFCAGAEISKGRCGLGELYESECQPAGSAIDR
jgi:hypothetical protein